MVRWKNIKRARYFNGTSEFVENIKKQPGHAHQEMYFLIVLDSNRFRFALHNETSGLSVWLR